MRVTFVIPPSGFLLDERMFMPLGVLKVAAVLEQVGTTVDVLDLSGVTDYLEAVDDHLAYARSSVYAITATTPQLPAAAAIARLLRSHGSRVILGGPHVTLTNAAAKGERRRQQPGRAVLALEGLRSMVDTLVAGDGELAIHAALTGEQTLIDADDAASPFFVTNLDALPLPARHLLDVDSYGLDCEIGRATSVICQLGCPFACGFCGGRLSPTFRRIRLRTVAHLVAELEQLYRQHGYRAFVFMDDELNVSPACLQMFDAIADLQDRLGVRFALRGHIKAQLLTDAQAAAMVRAGFQWIFVGFESGDPRILANIQKQSTQAENTRCLEIGRRHGLKVKALMSIGHPGESAETLRRTADWLLSVRPDDFGLSLITVYPGTPYYDQAVETARGIWTYTAKTGDQLHAIDADYRKDVCYFKGTPGAYKSFVFTDALSAADLVAARDQLEREWAAALHVAPLSKARVQIEQSMGQCA